MQINNGMQMQTKIIIISCYYFSKIQNNHNSKMKINYCLLQQTASNYYLETNKYLTVVSLCSAENLSSCAAADFSKASCFLMSDSTSSMVCPSSCDMR